MTFLGIDQSLTSPGFAVLGAEGDDPLHLQALRTAPRRGAERLGYIWEVLEGLLAQHGPAYAALEGYSMASLNRPFDLGEVGGVIRLCLQQAAVPFVVVPPTSLKKFITGKGVATKQVMRSHTKEKYGIDIPQDDMCDAYGLAQVARACHRGDSSVRSELEVIRNLTAKPSGPNFLASAEIR